MHVYLSCIDHAVFARNMGLGIVEARNLWSDFVASKRNQGSKSRLGELA